MIFYKIFYLAGAVPVRESSQRSFLAGVGIAMQSPILGLHDANYRARLRNLRQDASGPGGLEKK